VSFAAGGVTRDLLGLETTEAHPHARRAGRQAAVGDDRDGRVHAVRASRKEREETAVFGRVLRFP
jgi:hypothetical protein